MGSGTLVLRDFAKIGALEHTGFKWRMGAPPTLWIAFWRRVW